MWANSVDTDPRGAVWSWSSLFAIPFAWIGHLTLCENSFSNFSLITAIFRVSEFLGFLRYKLCNDHKIEYKMSCLMTKQTMWLYAQWRLRSAWASTQSDQSLRCPHEERLSPYLPTERTAKTLIRQGGCPAWSESSLGARSLFWFCHEAV